MKRLFLFIILATSMIAAQPQWDDDDDMTPPPHGIRPLCEKLDLTADQQKQFDKMQSDIQKKQIDIRSKVQSLRIDIKDLFKEDNPDKGKIESKMNEVTKLQGEMKKNHLDFWFGVNKILKPEQQKIWKEHRMIFGAGMGPRGGHGMKGDFGPRMGKRGGHGMGFRNCPNPPCR
ncbi:MAG: periplasmic heavy metal sensor [Ignavibacteriales bacterium]|nr:periplasmic heavy metal sensor [Ignavibacteriales bacterium]